jgi:hypothetical protein
VSPALEALDRGAALPPPFDDHAHAFQALQSDARAPRTAVVSFDGRHERVSQQHAAIPSLFAAATADSLAAAAETIFHAIVTIGGDYRSLLTGLRREFPELTASG